MSAFESELCDHSIRLDGEVDLVFRPQTLSAFSGSFRMGVVPLRPGTWRDSFRRFFEPDRFLLRRGVLSGSLWLGSQRTPLVTALSVPGCSLLYVVTEHLLCASFSCRTGSRRLRLIPGSTQKTMTVTEFSAASLSTGLGPVVGTVSGVSRAVLEAGETLQVSPSSLVAWSDCPCPKSFCSRLRLRDLFIPRLPESLTLEFHGPGQVFFQGCAYPSKKRSRGL